MTQKSIKWRKELLSVYLVPVYHWGTTDNKEVH